MMIRNKKGFGIIEVLIASTIVIVILGALTAVGRSALRGSDTIQERTQAAYLAQEGIEIVRQIRDTNWIDLDNTTSWDSLVWNNDMFDIVSRGRSYGIQFKKLKVDNSSLYRFGLVSDSVESIMLDNINYQRTISIGNTDSLLPDKSDTEKISADGHDLKTGMKVTATVTWPSNPTGVSVSEVLTNWRPNY